MSVKKSEMIEALQAKNAELELEVGDLHEQMKRFISENVKLDDRYNEERERRREAQRLSADLEEELQYLSTQLQVANELIAVEKSKRHGSVPKFVIVAAIALVALMASFTLQKLCIIGPSVSFGIQCSMAMVIAWCYAIIWDRSRK